MRIFERMIKTTLIKIRRIRSCIGESINKENRGVICSLVESEFTSRRKDKSIVKIFEFQGFEIEKIIGVGCYFLPNSFSKILPKHSVYLTMKARKVRKKELKN